MWPLWWHHSNGGMALPNVPLLVTAVALLNMMYVFMGIVIAVRFRKLTDAMMPTVAVMIVLQVPIVYFLGVLRSKALLLIPSAAPVMLVQGVFHGLENWEWLYGIFYTAILIGITGRWAYSAFNMHVLEKAR